MANNRMFLRCRKCGGVLMIGKISCLSYFTLDSYYENDSFLEAFNKFCEEHTYCYKELDKNREYYDPKFIEPKEDIYGENQFEIAYQYFRE